MALDLTYSGLADEIRKSVDERDRFLGSPYADAVERFVGPGYRRNTRAAVDFNNHSYKILSRFLPLLASGNPRVRTKTPRQGSATALTKAVEFAVNRNSELQNLKKTIEELATDWFFKWCVSLTQPRPALGMLEREDPPYRPNTVRLSLLDYTWDPVAIKHSESRYQGHRLIRDKDSLLREAKEEPQRGWNRRAIERFNQEPNREKRGEKLADSFDRQEVEYWEVWVPEVQLDKATDELGDTFQPLAEEGFHGTIYTVAKDADDFLRAPRPFWGPRDGPYTFSGYLYVPDRSVPLSMLASTYAQAEVHNLVWNAAVQAIRKYKRGVAVSGSSSAELREKLAEFMDLGILSVEAFDDIKKTMTEIEMNGLSQQHMMMLQMLGLNLEQLSGLTEAAMGQVSGQGTATEASIAQMSSGVRMGYATEKFVTAQVKPIMQKEAWYSVMHPLSRIPLGQEADGVFVDPVTGDPIEAPQLEGGLQHSELLEDMDIEVEPISMRYSSELLEAERAQQQDAWLATFAPLVPSLPHVNWELVLSRKAEQWGDPSWARVINLNKASIMAAIQFQMNMAGVPQNPSQPQPRLGIDTQSRQTLKTSESPAGFSRNARPQPMKGPRQTAGASKETHAMPSKET